MYVCKRERERNKYFSEMAEQKKKIKLLYDDDDDESVNNSKRPRSSLGFCSHSHPHLSLAHTLSLSSLAIIAKYVNM